MATLHVRNVPDDLYKSIRAEAQAQRRSLSAQVIALLEEAVSRSSDRRRIMKAVLKRIRSRREAIRLPGDWKDSVELLREDRGR